MATVPRFGMEVERIVRPVYVKRMDTETSTRQNADFFFRGSVVLKI